MTLPVIENYNHQIIGTEPHKIKPGPKTSSHQTKPIRQWKTRTRTQPNGLVSSEKCCNLCYLKMYFESSDNFKMEVFKI